MNVTGDRHSSLVRGVVEQVDASVAGMNEAEMSWHPEGKWSAAEIIEHLSLAFLVTVKAGRFVLRQKDREIRRSTFLERVMVALVVDYGYFFMRLKAPRMVTPRGMAPEEAKKAMRQSLIDLDEVLRQCQEELGAHRNFLPHPFLGPLTVEQWRKFHMVHTRHHMKQVQALRRKMKTFASAGRANATEIGAPSA